ncbi:PKD domain-containing protein [Cellulomonas sp. NPDC057328]|uniref:PKD domain-containing protein n=1 Tax=Cellulomonas sp. NPDC057328 TaxID=3346101 RepID=UPI00362FFDC0
MSVTVRLHRRARSVALLAAALLAVTAPAHADTAPADPERPGQATTVTADALPTVQIDGVVWAQVVVGNTVYVAGEFTTARPAGAAPGTSTVPRANLLAYDIRTGVLDPTFAPVLDGQALGIAASPDGRRVYVTGDFNKVDGQWRVRIAAFDTATKQLVPGFRPTLASRGLSVTATDDTVYVGGNFTSVAPVTGATLQPRRYVAAFEAATGAVRPFTVDASAPVTALARQANGERLILGGRFQTVNGTAAVGLASVHPTTGATIPYPASTQIRNGSTNAAILSLVADETGVYGTGYHYGKAGNLEGTFRADPETGEIVWIADCHGDSYSVTRMGDVVYTASHSHYCGNIPAGFPQTEPWSHHHLNAFTIGAEGTNTPDIYGYPHSAGQPAPGLLHFYPDFYTGEYTGQGQAGWSVASNADYITMGGEFPGVNGRAQQGLVRFARSDIAPDDQGPRLSGADWGVRATSTAQGQVRVSWTGNYDRDNETLTYRVYRGSSPSGTPLATRAVTHRYWETPSLGLTDTGRPPGSTQTYVVTATDAFGNRAVSAPVSATVASAGTTSPYVAALRADEPVAHHRLGEPSGGAVLDSAGFQDMRTVGSGIARGVPGVVAGDGDTATDFPGTSGSFAVQTAPTNAPDRFSVEAWVRTTTSRGGAVVGFGSSASGLSGTSTSDRVLYLDNSGRANFGTYGTDRRTLRSPAAVNDGAWHQLVGTYEDGVMRLFVDGQQVGERSDAPWVRPYWGYWRIGGDRVSSFSNAPSSNYLDGAVDEVSVWGRALSPAKVAEHHAAALATTTANRFPTAAFTTTATDLRLDVDGSGSTDVDGTVTAWAWDFGDGTTGTGPTATRTYTAAGTYTVRLTVTDDRGDTGTAEQTVTVTAPPPPNQAPTAAFTPTLTGADLVVDGSASADPDGTLVSHAWEFGDGGTATGATATHTYAGPGTYPVRLTVTDDDGATATTERSVTVAPGPGPVALVADAFGRTSASGWGAADQGGTWVIAGSAGLYQVQEGTGRVSLGAGSTPRLRVDSTAVQSADVTATVTLDRLSNAGTTTLWLAGRTSGWDSQYEVAVRITSTGATTAQLVRRLPTGTTTLANAAVPGGATAAGAPLRLRLQLEGSGTTALRAKVWPASAAEPSGWLLQSTDATPELQDGGGVGLGQYTASATTNGPVRVSWDDLSATALG